MHLVFHVSRLKKFLHPGDSLVEGIVLFQEIEDNADRKSTRLNSSHSGESRMPSSA